jgi:hypothetical protein
LPETVYFKDTKARKVISNRVDYLFLGAENEQEVLGKTDLELFDNELGKIGYDHDFIFFKQANHCLIMDNCTKPQETQICG